MRDLAEIRVIESDRDWKHGLAMVVAASALGLGLGCGVVPLGIRSAVEMFYQDRPFGFCASPTAAEAKNIALASLRVYNIVRLSTDTTAVEGLEGWVVRGQCETQGGQVVPFCALLRAISLIDVICWQTVTVEVG